MYVYLCIFRSPLASWHQFSNRCVCARALYVYVSVCAWKNVCEYVSKEAERGPHCEKGDERVQLEEMEEAGVKRDGKE